MDTVNIRGIFEDPEELAKFDCDGGDCYDDNMDYPLSADLISAITDGLIKGTFQMIIMTSSDTENDTMQTGVAPRQQGNAKAK